MKTRSWIKLGVTLTVALIIILVCCLCTDRIEAAVASAKLGDPHEHAQFAGTLYIPSVGIELPCIGTDASDFELSELAVDSYSCGAKAWYSVSYVIESGGKPGIWIVEDHNWQGFADIKGCQLGDIVEFIDRQGASETYIVRDSFEGYIDGEGFPVDAGGEPIWGAEFVDMALMTCYPEAVVPAERNDRRFFVCLELVG